LSRTTHHEPDYDAIKSKGNFKLSYHLEMVSDSERVTQFKKAIDKVVNSDTIFCELGCGSGIFSIHAARTAKKVYAIELDPNVYEFAKKNIEASGLTNIELINANALEVQLPEKVDVIFCEMLSIWMIDEPEVLVMNYAVENLLKPSGITIPEKIVNICELCESDYVFDGIELKASTAQFTGIKQPRVLTQSQVFNEIILSEKNDINIEKQISFQPLTSSIINSIRLTSLVKLCDGVNFYTTDTLMPQTIMPLENEVFINENTNVTVNIKYTHRSDIDSAMFKIV